MHLFKESVEFNIQKLFTHLGEKAVTGSAFTQARYKIKHNFFKDLCEIPLDLYARSTKQLWKGHVLLAGDGSTLLLPNSKNIQEEYGIHSKTRYGVTRSLSRVFFIYDVMNDFVVESNLSHMSVGEKPLLFDCLDRINQSNSLLTLDRGFGNYCTINELSDRNQLFCIRLSVKQSNFAKNVMSDKQSDFITEWHPSNKERENSLKLGLKAKPLKVRVSKVRLKSGEIELLVSNLSNYRKYKPTLMKGLYNLRWGVEEAFKNLKPKMKIEQFGCKKTEGVMQEFYAHIFCMNMTSLTGMVAQKTIQKKTKNRQLKYKYNWKNAYRFFRERIYKTLLKEKAQRCIKRLVDEITNSIIAVVPDRSFARDTK